MKFRVSKTSFENLRAFIVSVFVWRVRKEICCSECHRLMVRLEIFRGFL